MWQNYLERSLDKTSLASATLLDGLAWEAITTGGVVQQGLIHLVPHLAGQPMLREPDAHPSGKPLPMKPAQTKTPSMGASGKWPDRTQPAPGGSGQAPAPNQSG